MSSEWQFVLTGVALILGALAYKVGPKNVIRFFRDPGNKRIVSGILFALGFCIVGVLISLLTGCNGSYFNNASVYAGLEEPDRGSPVCLGNGHDQMTSNLGARLNVYE